MKTSELTGAALDWAVAKCKGRKDTDFGWWWDNYKPSTDWVQGGPIIEREIVSIDREEGGKRWKAFAWRSDRDLQSAIGPTPLIAAMRCYCCAKLGDEIDIPEELCQQQSN